MANEKRLIAFDPITFESFTRHATKHREPYDHYDMGYVDAVDQIECWLDANTVEAVEVVHGRWIWTITGEEDWAQYYVCSECGERSYTEDNYCPNCCRNSLDGYSQVFEVKFSENDFCSYGERRTE